MSEYRHDELKLVIELSANGIAIKLVPDFDSYQPLFEIDSMQNVLVQGKKIGYLNDNREVIFD